MLWNKISIGSICFDYSDLENFDEYTISLWIDPPEIPRVKIYVFNFTNPDEFLAGAKPKLEELGPYVFL